MPNIQVRKSRRTKRLRLSVYCDGRVVLSTPVWLRNAVIEKFIFDRKQWVTDKLTFFKSLENRGIRFFSKKDYQKYKNETLRLTRERISYFNNIYGFVFNKISIKNQKTRWGSCSKKKNLNFNYKILFLTETQRDYIIVHELCHLKEFNHSRKFWLLVEKAMPNYLNIRKELRRREIYYK